jgi:hypothetical protein
MIELESEYTFYQVNAKIQRTHSDYERMGYCLASISGMRSEEFISSEKYSSYLPRVISRDYDTREFVQR